MKAKKTGYVEYGKYSNTVEYEYKGHKYDVVFARDCSYCCTPAHIQHRDAQERIDKMLESKNEEKPIDMNEIWELMGWD